MIVAIVVPFGWRSIASTASCLEEDGTDAFADVALVAPAFCFGLDLVWEVPFAARGDLRTGLTDLNFDFLAAILDLPCVSGSVERCH